MAAPCLNASNRKVLGTLAAFSLNAVPVALAHTSDRSAWEKAVKDHAAATAAATLAARQEDAARAAFIAECPAQPPLCLDIATTRLDGTPMVFPCDFASEAELRGKGWLDDTHLGAAHDQARKILIPQWDAWRARRDELYRKHRIDELDRAATDAWEEAFEKHDRLMNTPAPDIAAVLHKLTVAWGEEGGAGDPNQADKLAIFADLRRLAKATH